MRRPLLVLSLALGAGTLFGGSASPLEAAILLGLAACLLALAVCRASTAAALAGLVAAALAIGAAAAGAERARFDAAALGRWLERAEEAPVRLSGRAAADAGERDGRTSLVLDVADATAGGRQLPLAGRVRVAIAGDTAPPPIIEGDRVSLWAQVWCPRSFHNPGARDAAGEARREGVHAVGYCKTGKLVEVAAPADGGFWHRVAVLRAGLRRRLERFVPPGPEQAVVRAMVLGDRTALDRATAEAFRIAGTYHVLALSGAQVALVATLALGALRRLRVPPLLTALLVSGLVIGYSVLVGSEVPVVRAAVLAVVVLVGRALDLDADLVNLLGLAGGVLLLARPSDVADLGFQLSFAATLGILLLATPLRRPFRRLPLGLDMALAASFAAQLALAPLLAFHFHRLAPAALVLNLVAVPLATAVLLLGALTVVLSMLPGVAQLVGGLAHAAAHALLLSGSVVQGVPLLDARTPTPSPALVIVHIVALAWLAAGKRARLAGLATAVSSLLMATGLPGRAVASGRLELTLLDVGQGDALVLRSPFGRLLMLDAGGSYDDRFDVGESVLGPYLWAQGTRSLDALILSHAHPDHVGGAPFLVKSFRVGEVWEGLAPRRDRAYAALDRALSEASVPRRSLARGVRLDWDGVLLEVLGPAPHGPAPATTRNDDSVVVLATYGAVRLLLTGDIEAAGEAALETGPVTVLKVAHHGSRTSSAPPFLARAAPQVALISVGRRNPFGHPHPEVLERYRRAGIRVFRTDLDGAVTLCTDGRSVGVRTERSGEQGVYWAQGFARTGRYATLARLLEK